MKLKRLFLAVIVLALVAGATYGLVLDYPRGNPFGHSFSDSLPGGSQGDILYHNGSGWVALTAGTSGYYLQTQGAGQNPQWAAGGGGTIELAEAGTITYGDETLATSDHTYSGFDGTLTAGENLVFGNFCYYKSDGKFWKTDADAAATTEGLIGVAAATISADASGTFILPAGTFIRDDSWNWTTAAKLYLDTATSGALTETQPSGSGDQVRIVAYAITDDVIYYLHSAIVAELE